MKKKTNKPKLVLSEQDGNAFSILGRAKKVADRSGWTKEQWESFKKEATSDDYDHLLITTMKYFDVE